MLEATVVTLREGIEAALVLAIVLAYLRRTGRGGAVAVQRFGLDPESELWEGSLMLVAAALVGSLVMWMWRAGRRIRQQTEVRLEALLHGGKSQSGTGIGLFTFTFLMVFREGIEAVQFLAALSGAIGANPLYNALGGGLGLL